MLWLATLLCAGLFSLGWWVSRPVGWFWRWVFRLAFLLMLLGLVLPPAGVDWIRDVLSVFVPLAREASDIPGVSYLVHFTLFAVVSGLLFWIRTDLGRLYPALAMAALAFITEGLQLLVDGRFASWGDVGMNLVGVAVAAALVWTLQAMLSRRQQRSASA